MEKVYCGKCKFSFWHYLFLCSHTKNKITKDSPIQRSYELAHCEIVNINNDCKLFEQKEKWWKFWVK